MPLTEDCRPGGWRNPDNWIPPHPWPENCCLQFGPNFFEAFPRDPDTLIRADAETYQQAEEKAWKWFQKITACPGHEFERRDYKNGVGFCKHCGMFKAHAFEPLEHCCNCGKATYHNTDKNGDWWCKDCEMPKELWTPFKIQMEEFKNAPEPTEAEFTEALDVVINQILKNK